MKKIITALVALVVTYITGGNIIHSGYPLLGYAIVSMAELIFCLLAITLPTKTPRSFVVNRV